MFPAPRIAAAAAPRRARRPRTDDAAPDLRRRRVGGFVEPQEETIVVLLQGRGTFATGAQSWNVARADVFSEPATALLVPPGHQLRVQAETPLEAIFISTPAPAGGEPILLGRPTWPSRIADAISTAVRCTTCSSAIRTRGA
jgi:hypothetical protein